MMESSEKINRLLQDDWEIHGDAQCLCLLAREHILSMQRAIRHVGRYTSDQWARQYIEWRIFGDSEQAAIISREKHDERT